jgi:hypothetical protein
MSRCVADVAEAMIKECRHWRLLTVMLVLSLSCGRAHIDAVVINASSSALMDVRLVYTGGEVIVGTLSRGTAGMTKVHVSGASTLILQYQTNETVIRKNLDVYVEPGYRGTIKVVVADGGSIQIENKIRVGTE